MLQKMFIIHLLFGKFYSFSWILLLKVPAAIGAVGALERSIYFLISSEVIDLINYNSPSILLVSSLQLGFCEYFYQLPFHKSELAPLH